MFDSVHPDWLPLFQDQQQHLERITAELSRREFIPSSEKIFRAFQFSPASYRVIILGQDPYPNPSHAIGLAFAVPAGTKPLPGSLRNLLQELRADLGDDVSALGDLARWQQAGVMLLNRHLTTSPNLSAAHFDLGWEQFTRSAVEFLEGFRSGNLVGILWGAKAQELRSIFSPGSTIESAHPSPLSAHRGFFGSRPFSRCNTRLLELGETPIDWSC